MRLISLFISLFISLSHFCWETGIFFPDMSTHSFRNKLVVSHKHCLKWSVSTINSKFVNIPRENKIELKFILCPRTSAEMSKLKLLFFSKCHGAVSCVWYHLPRPSDGRHLPLRMGEREKGITCHLLIKPPHSGNKAFHFLCGRKLPQHKADSIHTYPASISQVLLKWRLAVSHAAPPAVSKARRRPHWCYTRLHPGDLLQERWE